MLSSTSTPRLNFHDLDNVLTPPETEHNWAAKESAMKTLAGACNSSIAQNHEYILFIKNHRKAFTESLLTERTRLSGVACELVEKLSTAMGRDFVVHFSDFFTGALLKVCARTNKVMVSRAVKALNSVINAGTVALLPKACQAFSTPNKALRIACIGLVASCIAQFEAQELDPFLSSFEPVLKEGVQDAAPEVRDTSRKSFKTYALKFPERSAMLTSTLPQAVLKYLLPDSRPSTPSRSALIRQPATGRSGEAGELARHQSSKELSLSQSRPGSSRIGPVRARTIAVEQSSSSFKAGMGASYQPSPSSQPYAYHSTQSSTSSSLSMQRPHHQQQQQQQSQYNGQQQEEQIYYNQQHNQQQQQQQPSSQILRHHGPAIRTGSMQLDSSDAGGHAALRMAAQRSRALSSNSMTTSSMIQRSPSINLTINGGSQRIASSGPYSADSSKPTRSSTLSNRLSKAEPITKANRVSAISTQAGSPSGTMDREPLSASERAKAYSASLKTEMANRRSHDLNMRSSGGVKRITTEHAGYAKYNAITSTSSTTSGSSVSAATSTTSVSSGSSTSTSPTTLNSPLHDQLFSTFRPPANPYCASSPTGSTHSTEPDRSSPPISHSSPQQLEGHTESPTHAVAQAFPAPQEAHADIIHSSAELLSLQPAKTATPPPSSSSPSFPQYSNDTAHGLSHYIQPVDGAQAERCILAEFVEMETSNEDQHMSIPDHESLFGRTENYLQIEKEILELQHGVPDLDAITPSKMDEDIHHPNGDQEELAIKAYADAYEATLQARTSPAQSASTPERVE